MEKFPEDVVIAEKRTGGDPNIIHSEEFQPVTRPNIASIFGDNTPKVKKGKGGRRKANTPDDTDLQSYSRTAKRNQTLSAASSPAITPARSNYSTYGSTPSRSYGSPSATASANRTPASAAGSSGADYKCHHCNFSTNRLNVIIFHNRTHSSEKKQAPVVETPPGNRCNNRLIGLLRFVVVLDASRRECQMCHHIYSNIHFFVFLSLITF